MYAVISRFNSKLAQVVNRITHHNVSYKADLKPNKTTRATFKKSDRGEELQSFNSPEELFASWKK